MDGLDFENGPCQNGRVEEEKKMTEPKNKKEGSKMKKFSMYVGLVAAMMLWSVATVSAADLLFDDFSGTTLNPIWGVFQGTATVSNGELITSNTLVQNSGLGHVYWSPGVTMECRLKASGVGSWGTFWALTDGSYGIVFSKPWDDHVALTISGIRQWFWWDLNFPSGFDPRNYHTYKFVYNEGKQEFYIDDYLIVGASYTGMVPVLVRFGGDLNMDWVRVYPSNELPVADCKVGLDDCDLLVLDSSGSYDPDGTIVSYLWTVDSTPIGTKKIISAEDFAPGIYDVTLTVTDNKGATDSCKTTLVKPANLCLQLDQEDPTACGLDVIYVSPGMLNNQHGLSRNPNAGIAVLLVPPKSE